MANNGILGQFLWYELSTTDPAGAKRFYPEVIGWATQEYEGGMIPYSFWMMDGRMIGGLMELPQEARDRGVPPHWMPYIGTPDVDATAAQAQKLGGQVVVAPMDIPDIGRFAVLKDPQGAAFSIFKPGEGPDKPIGPPQTGDFSWHELLTTDYQAAFKFYSTLFGWVKTSEMDMGPAGTYLMYGKSADVPLGGMFNKTPDMPFPPNWTLYVRVPSIKKAVERARKLGANVLIEEMEVPGGDLIAQVMDPQNAVIAMHESRQPVAQ
ncbi:MAG TPA: VOC family protein [Gemmatimonadaceae bacterium]|jgi:predicted enzyme related to lactoylglutathione lyase|nr:VOC family protein [Gemmatimonadaceae bacterium]